MELLVTTSTTPVGDDAPVEVVERKGLGHPDTICDAVAEEFSLALSRFYLDRFGAILHHNVDKVLLTGGAARPAFGGGRVLAPIEIFLAGTAVREFRDVAVPVEELAREAARTWLEKTFRHLDPERNVRLHCKAHPGSVDLLELFERKQHTGFVPANDTSCGAGHAPRSTLERLVLAVEHRLNAPIVKDRSPFVGEDIKVMGVRTGERIALTVACAMVDRHLADLGAYRAGVEAVEGWVREAASTVTGAELAVSVNTGDDLERGQVYLTVTGTSAEAGDQGSAGRGNRIGGLITPHRAMTLESAAGKNPVSHVGKLYNVLAQRIAASVVEEVPEVAAAECILVSQIGRALPDAQLVQVAVTPVDGGDAGRLRPAIAEVAHRHLATADELWRQFLERAVQVY